MDKIINEITVDSHAWDEVQVTLAFSVATALAFSAVFETSRRSPSFARVFQSRRGRRRRRRTDDDNDADVDPLPPLVRSRIFEWLFLSTDARYLAYARMKHLRSVLRERHRQRRAVRRFRETREALPSIGPATATTFTPETATDDEDDEHSPPPAPEFVRDSSNHDEVVSVMEEGVRLDATPPTAKMTNARKSFAVPSSKEQRPQQSSWSASANLQPSFFVDEFLTPEVCEYRGYRIPAELADYAIAGDLTDEQLKECERTMEQRENEEEAEFVAQDTARTDNLSFCDRLRFLGLVKESRVCNIFGHLFRRRERGRGPSDLLSDVRRNRHLRAASTSLLRRQLNDADKELLDRVGMDSFVFIRFLRFGFDVSFVPFVLGCFVLMPTYYVNSETIGADSSSLQRTTDDGGRENHISSDGYFKITFNALESGSEKLWVVMAFAVIAYSFVLRRLWQEWETFVALRYEFLALGSDGFYSPVELEQYQNSCMVEYVPESHRRDKELFDFFDAVFPGQIRRAEMLLNATELTSILTERQRCVETYENIYARHAHANSVYRRERDRERERPTNICDYLLCRCSGGRHLKKPSPPLTDLGRRGCLCCKTTKMVKALPYFLSEIKRLNEEAEEEHRRLSVRRNEVEDDDAPLNLIKHFVRGGSNELMSGTGFVEFKNLTTKQSAIQCNLSGTIQFLTTKSAPDPRDIIWENASANTDAIQVKTFQCHFFLLVGTLFWSFVVTFLTTVPDMDFLNFTRDSFYHGAVRGYIPVILLEILMALHRTLLRALARRYIRFKTRSETDNFVFLWHFGYRLANLLIIVLAGSITEAIQDLGADPQTFVENLARGIAIASQFFLNYLLIQAFSENFFELAQTPKMARHFIIRTFITTEAKSERALNVLNDVASFQWSRVVPPFIFAMSVGLVYCPIVPIVTGAATVCFYLATKVYTHQALYVYSQRYESGGMLMYSLNRMILVQVYVSILIFSTLLGLKEGTLQAPFFFCIMMTLTFVVDRRITSIFVQPSLTLALTNARALDDENKRKAERGLVSEPLSEDKEVVFNSINRVVKRTNANEDDGAALKKESFRRQHSEVGSSSSSLTSNSYGFKVVQKSKTYSSFITATDESLVADSEDNEYDDFYLYRQPQLNKSKWEIKPMPYRSNKR